ncbi:MAG: aspartate-semialdehyde dehydrogenase [Myxococcales bacterium]|nr:aspartate-semialdehyde dehydrogenase [Myxococcales bacterium]
MRICILGATGLVGRELLDLIPRAWPDAELQLFASRDQELALADGRRFPVRAASALDGADAPRGELALVALDDAHSARYVPRLLELGYRVIDKSNTYRLDPAVPLVVAGVNDGLVDGEVRLVANPNCTTIPLMLALAPLIRRFGIEAASVATYQAISGAGQATLDAFLAASGRAYADADRIGLGLDPAAYVGNTVPHSGGTDEGGFSKEERKLMVESAKILGIPDLALSAQCCRVAVAVGHYEQAWVTLGPGSEELSPAAIEALLAAEAPFVRVLPGSAGDGLSALACVHARDLALVGRIRRDPRPSERRTFCMTVAADNLRLGAATNAVRIASRWFPAADAELQGPGARSQDAAT